MEQNLAKPIFSVVIFAWRPDFLKRSMEALLNQTLRDIEILLVDNFPAQDRTDVGDRITKMVAEYAGLDSRVIPLRIPRTTPPKGWSVLYNYDFCCKRAVKEARGKYLFIQNDDDFISNNFLEKMVGLFSENPNCLTATGKVIAHWEDGRPPEPKEGNSRSRYTPGHILALDHARNGTLFSAPSLLIFAYDREKLMKLGGHPEASIEQGFLFGIVPFGDSGLDESAEFFWSYHPDQFNKTITADGYMSTDTVNHAMRDLKVFERWEREFGADSSREIHRFIYGEIGKASASWFGFNLSYLRLTSCFRIIKTSFKFPTFWTSLPNAILKKHIPIIAFRELLVHAIGKNRGLRFYDLLKRNFRS